MDLIELIVFGFCLFYIGWNNNNSYNPIDWNEKVINSSLRRIKFDSYIFMTDLEEYPNVCDDYENEDCAKAWLIQVNTILKRNGNRIGNLNFKYSTNINNKNQRIKLAFQRQHHRLYRVIQNKIIQFKWEKFENPEIKRIFKLLSISSQSVNQTISDRLLNITAKIKSIYLKARPCHEYCLNNGEADITELFSSERDYDKLAGFWSAWRDVTGRRIKDLYIERMNLENVGAKENGYSDFASFKLKYDFEDDNFNTTAFKLYEEISPLYKQLHAYVRYCLSLFYKDKFNTTGPIPAHILGNVWGQDWSNLMPILKKCRNETPGFNIQQEVNFKLKSKSIKEIFQISEDFFTSIGLLNMTREFWERSVMEESRGKPMNCHGSAHNLLNGADFRIKMCTKKDKHHFATVHHEMGHIEYYMAQNHLPYFLWGAANAGFHEAIGDTISLSVKTPEHLKKMGLISSIPLSKDFDIDYLLLTSLQKIAFLPFALVMDSYIWSVYNGSVGLDSLNKHWWALRHRYQGIAPPITRTEKDFDPASKHHIAFGTSYLRYFISNILQFQFYESMCKLSGFVGPVHRCDFYGSKKAGGRLLEMMKKGRSQHWKDSLDILTETRAMSSKSLLNYFNPLYKWLKETNKLLNIPIGW